MHGLRRSSAARDSDGELNMLEIARLNSTQPDFWDSLERLLAWEEGSDARVETAVAEILADVRRRGDAAVLEFTAALRSPEG